MSQCCETTQALEDCCCCAPGLFIRRFRTSKEEEERLQAYKDQLQKELAGLEERIQKLKKK